MLPTDMLKQSLTMSSVVTHQPVQRQAEANPTAVQTDATNSKKEDKTVTEDKPAISESPVQIPSKIGETSVSKASEIKPSPAKKLYNVMVKYIAPILLIVIFASSILQSIGLIKI